MKRVGSLGYSRRFRHGHGGLCHRAATPYRCIRSTDRPRILRHKTALIVPAGPLTRRTIGHPVPRRVLGLGPPLGPWLVVEV